MSDTEVYNIGGAGWAFRRLIGSQVVQGEPLDVFIDDSAHIVSFIDTGNTDELLHHMLCAVEEICAVGAGAGGAGVGGEWPKDDGIEPLNGGYGIVPLLPDDPHGSD